VVSEIFIRYLTTTGLEKVARFRTDETTINLDLLDIATIDLYPIIWCENLESVCLRNNSLTEIDLAPLEKCGKNLSAIRLSHNRLQEIDLNPLGSCPNLLEVALDDNRLKRVDYVSLIANLLLRSVGSWPEVLVERYHKILWKSDSIG